MFNLNAYEKILKFKDLDNKSYEVYFKNGDFVIDIKRKLSKKIYKHYKNVVFMFKNEILFDDKLISDYNIEINQFILWFEGGDCLRYSNDDPDIIKCITIIDNCNNEDEYFFNMDKYKTVRMLKSEIARKSGLNEEEFFLEFNKIKLSINNDCKLLKQCGLLNDGCRIDLFHKNIIKLIIHELSIFEYNLSKFTTVGQLKQICSNKTNTKLNEISLRFNGKYLLDDEVTLEQCGLSDGCSIELFGGNMLLLYVKFVDRIYVFRVNEYCTVGKLKQLISEKFNIDWENFILCYNQIVFNDNYRLNEYGICNDVTLLVESDIRAGGCTYTASMIPLTNGYESFQITNMLGLDDLIDKICTKISNYDSKIDHSLIKLYSDADKINQITNDKDLLDLCKIDDHWKPITIYYEIISELDGFELIEKLGKGAFGSVYKYRDKEKNKIFALKKFNLSTDSTNKETFQREIDCYLRLKSHPRIIKYEKHFIVNRKSFILMEYMERGSLRSYMKDKDPFSEPRIARYAQQILEGLEYLHYNRILHRDLKGDNILLNENDNLKLCDFGLAKILKDLSSEDLLNGVVLSTKGTLNWMSPEIINGELCGPASDIWSFGATMVEIVTRKLPHDKLYHGPMVSNILAGKIIFDYPANSSDDMKSFINSCLKRNPKDRAGIQDLYQKSFLTLIQS